MRAQEWISILQTPVLSLWGTSTTAVEVVGFISGFACVWLVARQNIWNWPIGLLNNAVFFLMFAAARLYADSALQVVFAILAVYGWYNWAKPRRAQPELPVRRTTPREWAGLAACGIAGIALVTWWLAERTDSPLPLWDAAILVLSLLATYGQANKLLESWWLWISVDVISVPVYMSRSLHLTALLYMGFLVLCVIGLRKWSLSLATRDALPA